MKRLFLIFAFLFLSTAAFADTAILQSADGNAISAANPLQVTVVGGSSGSAPGAVTYLSCSDDIQTKVTAATAGDTLVLGSCTYSISSGITINKVLKIIGQGPSRTIIAAGANNITPITTTVDGLTVEGIQFTGTNILTHVIYVNLGSGTSGYNNWFRNILINTSNGTCSATGIYFRDAGGYVLNSTFNLTNTSYAGACGSQSYALQFDHHNTTDGDLYMYVSNSQMTVNSNDATGDGSSILRGIRIYNYLNTDDPYYFYGYIDASSIVVRDASLNNIEALHVQGARNIIYIRNSFIDGYGDSSSVYAFNNHLDIRCDDGSKCYLDNTVLKSNLYQDNIGTGIIREGGFNGQSLVLVANPQMGKGSSGVNANDLISAIGGQGSNASGTGSKAGGRGASVNITTGAGGVATASTTTGTGGAGGKFVITTSAGADQTAATSTTNVGGAGGYIELNAGDGGAGSGASTTNNGGAGGPVYISGGAAGSGASAAGAPGHVYIGSDQAGNLSGGFVHIGGTAVPGEDVEISSTQGTGGSTVLRLSRRDTTITAGDIMGGIDFWGNDTSLTTQGIFGQIQVVSVNTVTTDAAEGELRLRLTNSTTASSPATKAKLNYTNGWIVTRPSSEVVASAGTITADACGTVKFITSSGNVTTDTTNTFTAPSAATDGCCFDVVNSDSADTITLDNNTLTVLNGATDQALGPNDTLRICGSNAKWYQIGATGNN